MGPTERLTDFIRQMEPFTRNQIRKRGEHEADAVQRTAPRYGGQLGAFLWFVRHGTRPLSATAAEFRTYRPVAAALVARGEFPPEVLDLFK